MNPFNDEDNPFSRDNIMKPIRNDFNAMRSAMLVGSIIMSVMGIAVTVVFIWAIVRLVLKFT